MKKIKEWFYGYVTSFDVVLGIIMLSVVIFGIVAFIGLMNTPTKPNTVICITPTPIVGQQ